MKHFKSVFLILVALVLCRCKQEVPPHTILIKQIAVYRLPGEYYTQVWDGDSQSNLPDIVWELTRGEKIFYSSRDTLINCDLDTIYFDLTDQDVLLEWERRNDLGERDNYYHTYHLKIYDADGIDASDSLEERKRIVDIPFVPWTGQHAERSRMLLEYEGVDIELYLDFQRN